MFVTNSVHFKFLSMNALFRCPAKCTGIYTERKSLVALFISLQVLGRKYKYTNSYITLTVILLNCHFCNHIYFSHQRK